jgi:hypothetical protein
VRGVGAPGLARRDLRADTVIKVRAKVACG